MKKYPCYVPTYMRVGKVITHQTVPSILRPILVVHSSEERAYKKCYPDLEVVSTRARGIGKTRRFICKHAVKNGYGTVGMLDDDITGWIYKPRPEKYSGLRKATKKEARSRWLRQLRRGERFDKSGLGFTCSFTWRTALAFPHKVGPLEIKLGMVNECMLMNETAMRKAQFTLETCEDVESTVKWLLDGVIAGQDQYLGHTAPLTAHTAEGGGCGEYRETHPGYHYQNHIRLWEMFPEVVCKPVDTGKLRHGKQQLVKSRILYTKAARLGGVLSMIKGDQ